MMKDFLNIKSILIVLIITSIKVVTPLLANNKELTENYTCINKDHNHEEFLFFCDTCGCGSSGGSMGYGTGLNTNFIGVRYINQQYRSRDGIFNDSPWIEENFNTIQAWGNFPITERILLNVIVPYQFHNRTMPDNTDQHISGIGDMSVLVFYNLIKATPDSIVSIKPEHFLQIGGGVKLPTGTYEKANNEGSVNPSFQLGNGSLDYVIGLNYGFSYRNWGISTMLNYTIKTENPKEYQFGNQVNYGINAFKTYFVSDNLSLTPILGLAGERYGTNKEFGFDVLNTKGDIFLGKVSMEASYKRYSLGLVGMLPISQNLNNDKVELNNRTSIYLNVNF
ncbi:transporter [Cellulophaga sp. HaHaR_3_176]|uniref:transporter n=1 Tax=Cellulophaga sp. HaHaR_3_176 TaxID=1942464 RepID=UPI001C1F3C6C|nr:transporter [Cellulophaga sp. HaHaR_3_176]QWX84815.1 transporter [Cellulophaga sp. HaHaR_3_176]